MIAVNRLPARLCRWSRWIAASSSDGSIETAWASVIGAAFGRQHDHDPGPQFPVRRERQPLQLLFIGLDCIGPRRLGAFVTIQRERRSEANKGPRGAVHHQYLSAIAALTGHHGSDAVIGGPTRGLFVLGAVRVPWLRAGPRPPTFLFRFRLFRLLISRFDLFCPLDIAILLDGDSKPRPRWNCVSFMGASSLPTAPRLLWKVLKRRSRSGSRIDTSEGCTERAEGRTGEGATGCRNSAIGFMPLPLLPTRTGVPPWARAVPHRKLSPRARHGIWSPHSHGGWPVASGHARSALDAQP